MHYDTNVKGKYLNYNYQYSGLPFATLFNRIIKGNRTVELSRRSMALNLPFL
jgi:hypothetical protein